MLHVIVHCPCHPPPALRARCTSTTATSRAKALEHASQTPQSPYDRPIRPRVFLWSQKTKRQRTPRPRQWVHPDFNSILRIDYEYGVQIEIRTIRDFTAETALYAVG